MRRTVSHVDFLRIDRDAEITVEVPIVLEGEANEVVNNDGLVEQLLAHAHRHRQARLHPDRSSTPTSPSSQIGDAVRVSDLTLPEGVTTDVDPDERRHRQRHPRRHEDDEEPAEGEGARRRGRRGAEGEVGGVRRGRAAARRRRRAARRARRAEPGSATHADLLVVGLGNPGAEYADTRHNVGSDVVDAARRAPRRPAASKGKERALVAEVTIAGRRVALAVPADLHERLGPSVAPLVRRYGIDDLSRLVIVHDELDLPLGRMKVKVGGGLAGHNGLRSIKAHLHTDDFARVRIGVGKPPTKEQGADHVLSRPGKAVRETLAEMVERAAAAVESIIENDVESTMNAFNALPDATDGS